MTKPLQRSAFARLQVANLASGVANGVVMITVPWLVLERTDSPARAGLLAALVSIPGIFVSPVVGGLIDRIGRRAVSALSDFFSCLSVLLFVIGELVGQLGFAFIAAFAVLGAVFDPAGYTARKALIPNAAESSGIPVDRANGRHEGFFAAGWMVGPALGAWFIEFGGPTMAFAATSGLFLLAAFAVRSMRVREQLGAHHESDQRFIDGLRDGWRVLRSDRPLFTFTIGLTAMSGLYMPIDTVIYPTHFESIDNATGLGAVLSAIALGVVIGAFAYGRLAERVSSAILLRVIVITSTAALLPMGFLPSTPIFVTFAFLTGLAWGPFNPLWNSVVQRRIEPTSQGRIYGLQMSLLYAAPPLGQLVIGWSIEAFGLRGTFSVVLGIFALCAVLIATRRSLQSL
ncbi:MAG: MFS transporter [Actinobacteria bacterium]|nr:MFS transporter [Actinomycetota bacterium]